jgi:ubiquinone/menaquinone biosynthesis C-methylase UbiE
VRLFRYGIDAPGAVRNMALSGIVLLAIAVLAYIEIIPPIPDFSIGPMDVSIDLTTVIWAALWFLMVTLALLWRSSFGKMRACKRLLDRTGWTGDERVLDIGCGRGLLAIGAAKRLTTGRVYGIDIWDKSALTGNSSDAALANAEREGVADRIELHTVDMRQLPFDKGFFNMIVSRAALHQLDERADRDAVISEMARMLAPKGVILIEDVRHLPEYMRAAKANHLMTKTYMSLLGLPLALLTLGTLRPGTIKARWRT